MGQDNRQVPCRRYGEEIVITPNVDYEALSTSIEAIENAKKVAEAQAS